MKTIIAAAIISIATASVASAAIGGGTLTVSGLVESSINLTVQAAAGTPGGEGTAQANTSLGTVSKYSSAPSGFDMARSVTNWTLTGDVDVLVEKANLNSNSFTLDAQLAAPPATGVTWKLNGSTLSDSSATTVNSNGEYATTETYTWDIVFADNAEPGSIDNSINFTATAN